MAEVDILGEILKDQGLIAEGSYTGVVTDLSSRIETTTSGKIAYLRMKVRIRENAVHLFLPGGSQTLSVILALRRSILGKEVKVHVKHREYNEQVYVEGKFEGLA